MYAPEGLLCHMSVFGFSVKIAHYRCSSFRLLLDASNYTHDAPLATHIVPSTGEDYESPLFQLIYKAVTNY